MKRKAEITVFLSLVLVIMSGLVGVVIESARIISAKEQAKLILKNALNSSMSEYNQELFEHYGLILVDTTYKGKESGEDCFKQHVIDYVNENLYTGDYTHMCRFYLKNLYVLESENADSCDNKLLLDQIVQCESLVTYCPDDNAALDNYILDKEIMTYDDLYARVSDFTTKDKLILIKEYIEDEMCKNTGIDFYFKDCLVHVKVEAVFETESGYDFCVYAEK